MVSFFHVVLVGSVTTGVSLASMIMLCAWIGSIFQASPATLSRASAAAICVWSCSASMLLRCCFDPAALLRGFLLVPRAFGLDRCIHPRQIGGVLFGRRLGGLLCQGQALAHLGYFNIQRLFGCLNIGQFGL